MDAISLTLGKWMVLRLKNTLWEEKNSNEVGH